MKQSLVHGEIRQEQRGQLSELWTNWVNRNRHFAELETSDTHDVLRKLTRLHNYLVGRVSEVIRTMLSTAEMTAAGEDDVGRKHRKFTSSGDTVELR